MRKPERIQSLRRALRRALLGWPRDFVIDYAPPGAVCAEVGVWRGDFSARILARARPRMLHLIDPWAYLPEFEGRCYGGRNAWSQADMDAIYEAVVERFHGREDVHIHRVYSAACDPVLPSEALDWVYLDANHGYEHVRRDLELFRRKVRSGGILAGDDYTWGADLGHPVRRAVEEFLRAFPMEVVEIRSNQFVLRKP